MPESILHEMKVLLLTSTYSRSRIDQRRKNLCEGVVEKAEELSHCVLCLVKANAH